MGSISQNIKYNWWQTIKAFFVGIGLYKCCPICGTDIFSFNGTYCKRLGCKHNLEEI